MKEKILEMLTTGPDYGNTALAEDITAMVMEFVDWLLKRSLTYSGGKFYVDRDGGVFELEMGEMFNYWLTNIYKK